MTPENFAKLKAGDTVRHKQSAQAMTVTHVDHTGAHLIRTSRASNPVEWLLIGDDGQPVYDEDDA